MDTEILREIREIKRILLGDGHKPGMITRIDRLEQAKKFVTWALAMISGSVAVVVAERLLK